MKVKDNFFLHVLRKYIAVVKAKVTNIGLWGQRTQTRSVRAEAGTGAPRGFAGSSPSIK